MSDNEVSLDHAAVGGDFTGRDNFSTKIISQSTSSEYINHLYAQFELERELDPELQILCDELDHLNTQKQNEQVIGLEDKLKAGAKQPYFIEYALDLKDRYYRKLMKNTQYSLVAQHINVHLLTKIKRTFLMEIFPMICSGAIDENIQLRITERIINPTRVELGINLFMYTDEDIMGMIFYLTGNCHLKWCA